MRAISWSYPPDIAPTAAARAARRFARAGVNTVLTEDNRYLLYDPPDGQPPPHFHFRPTPRTAALRATRIVVQALHAAGIRVIHHVTACYATHDFMQQHRDWTQRDARRPADPLFFGDYGGVWLFCPNNPDFRKTFFATLISFAQQSGVDGWMIDEVEFLPDWFSCGCEHCRSLFHHDTACSLPSDPESPTWANYADPIWRAWIAWRMTGPARFFADLKRELDTQCPGQLLTSCHAGVVDTWSAQYWGIDEVALSPHLNLVFYEAYVRDSIPYHAWPRFAAELEAYAACARATPNPPLALFYPRSSREAAFCWALASSRGFRLWGLVPSRAKRALSGLGAATPSPGFAWQASHESAFRPGVPHTGIGLLFSKPSRDMVSPMDNSLYIDEYAGWANTMTEANIPYRVVLDRELAAGQLDGVRLLVMPNAVCMSDSEIEAVRRFRAAGGQVVSTADTAARDDTGALRPAALRERFVGELDVALPGAPGRSALRRYARRGEPIPTIADPPAAALIRSVLAQFPAAVPWRAQAPEGVSVNVLRHADQSLCVHLLNAPGALAAPGRPRRKLATRAAVRSSPARDIVVEIDTATRPAGTPVVHYFAQPTVTPCPFSWDGSVLRVSVATLDEYAVIEVPAQ